MLAATLGQNRFAYYFAVNVAVLTAYLSWKALEFAGLKETPEGIEVEEVVRDRKGEKEGGKTRQGKKSKQRRAKQRNANSAFRPGNRYLAKP
jgi:hypothetical protein